MAAGKEEPRDLLAERIRRLEARIGELGDSIDRTRAQVERATVHLDTLVDLVGRLGRVVDVQGSALHVEEDRLARRVDGVQGRVESLADGLADAVSRLESAIRAIEPAGNDGRGDR
ncbi:MAG: hypothetical protein ACKO2K_15055 [Alphaproteobacteria bacterium]